jgi:hypothetical protein
MKNTLFVSLIVLALSLPIAAFGIQDFSGTWALNQENDQAANLQSRLSITQQENMFRIKSSLTPVQREYIVDGTERQRASAIGASIYTAKWDGEALVIDETLDAKTPFGGTKVTTHEVWSISSDRQTLTVTRSSINPNRNVTARQVYAKVASQQE